MKFSDSKSALNWMINNPLKKLYINKYGNYATCVPHSNVIEYWYYIDGEDEDYCGWDLDRLSLEEFIKQFDNEILSTD